MEHHPINDPEIGHGNKTEEKCMEQHPVLSSK
jgi:hypothetical protein